MKKQILITTAALESQNQFRTDLIKQLCLVPPEEWSPREREIMDRASEFGEIYPMEMEVSESPIFTRFTTDLGDPESKLIVIIHTKFTEPGRIKAAELVQLLAEGLGS